MKRIWMIVAACVLLALLAACAGSDEPVEAVQPVAEEAPVEAVQPAVEEAPAHVSEPEQAEAAEAEEESAQEEIAASVPDGQSDEAQTLAEGEAPSGPTAEAAQAFIDQDVSALIEAFGEPVSASYEASCMGDGDDGILQYDGFVVFTYREPDGSAETVIDAE